jgi:hypothetical protein
MRELILPRRITSSLDGDLLRLELTDASLATVVVGLSRAMIHVLVLELAEAVAMQTQRRATPAAASLRVV